jgi:hypothetical protein
MSHPPSTLVRERSIEGTKKLMLYLSFFGDGPKWDNFVRLAAYPPGFSYFRPFRYRDERIHPELLERLNHLDGRGNFVDATCVISLRFLSQEQRWLILPLRKACIRHIDRQEGDNSVYFTLGEFADFSSANALRERCIAVPESERTSLSPETIFFESAAEPPDDGFVPASRELAAWTHYCDLISAEHELPIREEARNAVYLRFRYPTNGDSVPTTLLHKSRQEGSRYGTELKEGGSYEFVYHHRVPALIGSHDAYSPLTLACHTSTSNLELHRAVEEISGNYEHHVLEVSGISPSRTYEELTLAPGTEMINTNGGQTLYLVSVPLPLRVKWSLWYRASTRWWRTILLFLSLMAATLFGSVYDARTNDIDFPPIRSLLAPLIISTVATLMISSLQGSKN